MIKTYTCKFCNAEFQLDSHNAGAIMKNHTCLCDLNPNKQHYLNSLKETLRTKYLNSIKSYSFKCKICGKNFKKQFSPKRYLSYLKEDNIFCSRSCANTRKYSEETKKKISEIMKQKLANGEIITPYIRNHHSKGPSYPEQYFMNVFKNANINVEYDYHVGLYQLDFANPKTKKYVEIDGNQHYFDKRIVDHDIKRTENLSEKGWVLITRINWSEFQKLSLSEREKICNLIIQQLR